jgi:sulfite exporter TauE/SafE
MVLDVFGTDVLLFLTIGLLGGAHCIGMCGPLVTIYSERMNPQRTDGGTMTDARSARQDHLSLYEVRQHALFNLGRTLSYTLIGALMGALGGFLFVGIDEVTTATATVRGVVGIGTGLFVMGIGSHYVLGRLATGLRFPGANRAVHRITQWVDRLTNGPGIIGLGALHGLLPCPILYPAYLYAFMSGSPLAGGIALAALGTGTMPSLFLYGTLLGGLSVTTRRRLHRLLGVAFLCLGYILIAHGLMSLGIHIPHPGLPFWNPLGQPGAVILTDREANSYESETRV